MDFTRTHYESFAERLVRGNDHLWLEAKKAAFQVADKNAANRVLELMVDQTAQWQRLRRQLEGDQ